MRVKKVKGPLRNFFFEQEADEALVNRSRETGRHMVNVIEDLLLERRQFSLAIEQFILTQVTIWGIPRLQVIENALIQYMLWTRADMSHAGVTPLPANSELSDFCV